MEEKMLTFEEKLDRLLETAKKKKNVLEEQEILDVFAKEELTPEKLDQIYDFLDNKKVDVLKISSDDDMDPDLFAEEEAGEENMENLGLEQDAICTVRDVLEKVVTDYQILPAKPNMEEVKRALTLLENHAILQRIEGKFNQNNCQIAILPTILSAVSADKLNLVVSVLRKEEPDEETEENPTD